MIIPANTAFRELKAAVAILTAFAAVHATVLYTSVNQDSLTVGDRVEFCVSIVAPKGATIMPPATEQGFGQFSVKEWQADRIQREKSDSLVFKYLITAYKVEPCSIPALPFIQVDSGSGNDTLLSRIIPIRMVSVIQAAQGETIDIKDLKPQQKAGKPSLFWLWLLAGALIILIASLLFRHYWRAHQKPKPVPPPPPPYDEAIAALAALDAKRYLERGMTKEYVFELSAIFKRYIERRFEIGAQEFTTQEILDWLIRSPFDSANRRIVEWFFKAADPIKFARFVPDTETLSRMMGEVRSLLANTRPRPEAAAAPAGTPVAPKETGKA